MDTLTTHLDALTAASGPIDWPSSLAGDTHLTWLRICVEGWSAARTGQPLEIASIVQRLGDALREPSVTPEGLVQTAESLSRIEIAEVQELFSFILVLLSAVRLDDAERLHAVQRAAVAIGQRALSEASAGSGAAIAVRLARLLGQLGDANGAEQAWTEAVRRDPLLGWALASEVGVVATLPAIEATVIDQTFGEERQLRQAVRALRRGDREAGRTALEPLVAEDAARPDALFLRAVEHVRDAAATAPRSTESLEALVAARSLLDRLPGTNPAVALLTAVIEVVGLNRQAAVEVLRRQLAELTGLEVDPAEATAIVAALTDRIRRPPFDPQAILQAAYFDAMLDPLLGVEVPRGPFASFRKLVIGLSLVSMMSSAGSAFAMVQKVDPPLDKTPAAVTHIASMASEADGSTFHKVLIPPVQSDAIADVLLPSSPMEGGPGLERQAPRVEEVVYVRGHELADRRQIPEGYWLSEMITPNDVSGLQEDGVRVVLSAVRPSAETLDALANAGIEQVTVRMGATFRHADTIRQVAARYQPQEILVHCTHGADRTGSIAAFLLVENHGWDVADAFYAVVYPRAAHVEGLAYALGQMGIDDVRSVGDPGVGIYSPGGAGGGGGLKAHNEAFREIIYTAIHALGAGHRI